MCIIELVDFNESMLAAKADVKTKTTRRSRRSPKAVADESATAVEKKPAAKTVKKKVEVAEKAVTTAKAEEVTEPVAEEEVGEDLPKDKE
jgi:large subunit ribosomal protein L17